MRNITLKALVVLAGVFSAAGAFAQSNALTANVPFAFSVENKVLPAGNYEIEQISNGQIHGGVLVRNIDHPQDAVLTVGSDAWQVLPTQVAKSSHLVFDNYNGQYFLREVRGPFNTVNEDFPVTKSEKRVQRQKLASQPSQTTIVAGQ